MTRLSHLEKKIMRDASRMHVDEYRHTGGRKPGLDHYDALEDSYNVVETMSPYMLDQLEDKKMYD